MLYETDQSYVPSRRMAPRRTALMGEIAATPAGDAEAAAAPLTVEAQENHVYFYAGVDSDRALALVRHLRDIDSMLRRERDTRSLPEDFPMVPIWLHIQSGGGWTHSAFGLVDQIEALRSPVYTVIEGYAGSAASLISMAGTKRYITAHSHVLIHEASYFVWGKHSEHQDEAKYADDIQKQLEQFYKAHSKINLTQIREMLKRDTWISAEEALEFGMVDEIIGGA